MTHPLPSPRRNVQSTGKPYRKGKFLSVTHYISLSVDSKHEGQQMDLYLEESAKTMICLSIDTSHALKTTSKALGKRKFDRSKCFQSFFIDTSALKNLKPLYEVYLSPKTSQSII